MRPTSLRALLLVAGALVLVAPALVVALVGLLASPVLALAAGLARLRRAVERGLVLTGQVDLDVPRGLVGDEVRMPLAEEPLSPAPPPCDGGGDTGGASAGGASPAPTGPVGDGRSRVLVADDDPIAGQVAAHLVKRLGYPVDLVADGQAAIDAVASGAYALVLMDCQMPGVDGFEATAEIRRREAAPGAQARRVPIVAITASTRGEDRERSMAAGMDAYLVKPLDRQRLAALLALWAPSPTATPEREPAPALPKLAPVPPVLDPAGLLGSSATLSPGHREVVDLFLAEVPRRLDALSATLERGDRAESARLAHTLAGSASSLGAGRLANACTDLEALARDDLQPSVRLAAQLDVVRQELRAVQTALAGA